MDNRIKQFLYFLYERETKLTKKKFDLKARKSKINQDLEKLLNHTENEIISGIINDLDYNQGLTAIIEMINCLHANDKLSLYDILLIKMFLRNWTHSCGLDYALLNEKYDNANLLIDDVIEFRNNVRLISIEAIKSNRDLKDKQIISTSFKQILKQCDHFRDRLHFHGLTVSDKSAEKES